MKICDSLNKALVDTIIAANPVFPTNHMGKLWLAPSGAPPSWSRSSPRLEPLIRPLSIVGRKSLANLIVKMCICWIKNDVYYNSICTILAALRFDNNGVGHPVLSSSHQTNAGALPPSFSYFRCFAEANVHYYKTLCLFIYLKVRQISTFLRGDGIGGTPNKAV